MFIYRLGKSVFGMSTPWIVLSLTKSSGWVALATSGVSIASIIGSIYGGVLTDKVGPKSALWFAGIGGLSSYVLIAVLLRNDDIFVGLIVMLLVCGNLLDAPASAAQESRLPELTRLSRFSLGRISATKSILGSIAALIGTAIAGVAIVRIGMDSIYWLIACCSASSALLAAPVMGRFNAVQGSLKSAMTLSGLQLLWKDDLLKNLTIIISIFSGIMTGVLSVLAPILFQQTGRIASDYGFFLSSFGAGSVLGAGVYALADQKLASRWTLFFAFCSYALALAILQLMPSIIILASVGFFAGLVGGPVAPLLNKLLLERTPLPARGRVLGVYSATVMASIPISIGLAGVGIHFFGVHGSMLLAIGAIAFLVFISLRLKIEPHVK